MLNTYKKYCHLDNLPNYGFLSIFSNGCRHVHGTHAVAASCRCYDRICTLYTHSVSENGVIDEK